MLLFSIILLYRSDKIAIPLTPPVSCLGREDDSFITSITVDLDVFLTHHHLMQLRALGTLHAQHRLYIGPAVVEILQGTDDGLRDDLTNFAAHGRDGCFAVFRKFGIKIDLQLMSGEFQRNCVFLTRRFDIERDLVLEDLVFP